VLDILWDKFGGTRNKKGYKVLDPHIRVIQGDGIDADMIWDILAAMQARAWSADNITFGSGGGLLQKFDRDTGKFAEKCSWVQVHGEGRDVWKDPITDFGKKSKRGRLALDNKNGKFETVPEESLREGIDILDTVFVNGILLKDENFEDVRKRARRK